MINTKDLVELDEPAAVRQTGSDLKTALDKVNTRADDVKSTWSGLAAHYKAPEQGEVLTAMNVPVTASENAASNGSTVKSALYTYASALVTLRSQKSQLITDINTFYADKTRIENENKDNHLGNDFMDFVRGEANDLLNRENDLNGRAAQLLADKEAAERACANAIGDIWGGEHYEAADETWTGDTTTYGMSAGAYEELSKAGDAPWGHPSMWSSDNWAVRGQMIGEGAWSSVTGSVTFLGDLTGFNGGGKAKAAWSGLGQLGFDLWATTTPIAYLIPGIDQGASANRLKEVGKGIIGWDNWDTSGWQTGGSVGLDVILTAATGGTAGAAKGSIKAASASRFVKFLGGTSKLDVKGTAAALRVRLGSSLNTRLDSLATLGQRLNERLGLQPAVAGPGIPDTRAGRPTTQPRHFEPPTQSAGPGHSPDSGPAPHGPDAAPDTPAPATRPDSVPPRSGETPDSGSSPTDRPTPVEAPRGTQAPDGGPTRDPAGRDYQFDDAGRRHVDGDPAGTFRDANGRLHDESGRYTPDANPPQAEGVERAVRAETTTPDLDPAARDELGRAATERSGLVRDHSAAVNDVNRLATQHGIDPDQLRTLRNADLEIARARREDGLSRADARQLYESVSTERSLARDVVMKSESMGETAARSVATQRGETPLVSGASPGSGKFDHVTYGDNPPRVTFYEAKGGTSALGSGRMVDGVRAQQGSTTYLNDVARSDPRFADAMRSRPELAEGIRNGTVEVRYEVVQAKPDGSVSVTKLRLDPDRLDLPTPTEGKL